MRKNIFTAISLYLLSSINVAASSDLRLGDITIEVLCYIFQHTDFHDLANLSQTCRTFYYIISDDILWKCKIRETCFLEESWDETISDHKKNKTLSPAIFYKYLKARFYQLSESENPKDIQLVTAFILDNLTPKTSWLIAWIKAHIEYDEFVNIDYVNNAINDAIFRRYLDIQVSNGEYDEYCLKVYIMRYKKNVYKDDPPDVATFIREQLDRGNPAAIRYHEETRVRD